MRQETLRWGLMMGLIAAILGTLAFAIGALIAPLRLQTSAEAVAFAVFTRAMFALITLGISLGLAYYAGLRSERDLRRANAAQAASGETSTQPAQPTTEVPWGERWNAVNTGGIVLLCFWIAATVGAYVFPLSQPGVAQAQNQALSNAELHLILLVIYVAAGAGAGGIGGRSYASRIVLDHIIVAPPSLAVARETKPTQEAATAKDSNEHMEEAATAKADGEYSKTAAENTAGQEQTTAGL